SDLTPEEQKLARAITQTALADQKLIDAGERAFMLGKGAADTKTKVYITDVEYLPPDKYQAKDVRQAITTVYRYRDDTTITTLVDLGTGKFGQSQVIKHRAGPLSEEEEQAATKLVVDDAKFRAAFKERPDVAFMRSFTPLRDTPGFGHRMVRVSF